MVRLDHVMLVHSSMEGRLGCFQLLALDYFFFFNIYLFMWLRRVLATACGLLSCSSHVGSSSLTRDRTRAAGIGSAQP